MVYTEHTSVCTLKYYHLYGFDDIVIYDIYLGLEAPHSL